MLTEHQLEIAARKLCELWAWPDDHSGLAQTRVYIKDALRLPRVQAIVYALAQPKEPT